MRSIWLRIEGAMARLNPPPSRWLPPGASEASVRELAALLPVPVPGELRQSLMCHDGTGISELDELPSLLSVGEIIAEYRKLHAGFPLAVGDGTVPFRPGWIPLQGFGGLWTLLDADPSSPTCGRLFGASVEENETFMNAASSLRVLLERAADAIEALIPSEPAAAGPPTWSAALVRALVESGNLELEDDADLEAIADAVEAAAERARGGQRAIAEAILDALVDAWGVAEVFAHPSQIIEILAPSSDPSR